MNSLKSRQYLTYIKMFTSFSKTFLNFNERKFITYKFIGINLLPYWGLIGCRILLTCLPQFGYIHPDEFFQSVEVFAGDIFNVEVAKPWEFNTTFPIRSVALPYIIVGWPLVMLKNIVPFVSFWFNINLRTPYMLLVVPRLSACILSMISDYSLFKICHLYGQDYRAKLMIFASSYVVLVYGTRTFSNMIEMTLMSVLLLMVSTCMWYSDKIITHDEYLTKKYDAAETPVERVQLFKLRRALPSHSLTHCLAIATVTVAGIFNRPTFIAFAFPPIFFWLQRGLGTRHIGLGQFHIRIFTFMLSGIPATIFFILVDSFYYGYLTSSEILELQISMNNFVVTPLNFLRYNLNTQNLEKHGLHPRCLHLLVNIPLLYNVLGIISIFSFLKLVYKCVYGKWSELPRVQSIMALMTASLVVPIAALSIFPHQEPRFLIPVTIPIVFLHSQNIFQHFTIYQGNYIKHSKKDVKFPRILLILWYLFNIFFALFYGFLHQGGVYPLTNHMSSKLLYKPKFTNIYLITSYTYSLPLFPLQIRERKDLFYDRRTRQRYRIAKQFHLYEMGSSDLNIVCLKLKEILDKCERDLSEKRLDYELYYALPASLNSDFHTALSLTGYNFTLSTEEIFYPHLTIEALPKYSANFTCNSHEELPGYCANNSNKISFSNLYSYVKQFSLMLLKVEKYSLTLSKWSRAL